MPGDSTVLRGIGLVLPKAIRGNHEVPTSCMLENSKYDCIMQV